MNSYINLITYSIKLHSIDVWLGKHTKEREREREKRKTPEREREKKTLQDPWVRKILESY